MSQEALASESGINRTYISAIERAQQNVSIDNLDRIGKGLRLSPWDLLRPDLPERLSNPDRSTDEPDSARQRLSRDHSRMGGGDAHAE